MTNELGVPLAVTDRTRLRRKRERGSFDRGLVDAILDEALVCHVGYATDHGPVVLPMTYARINDQLYLHGAARNQMLRVVAAGQAACVTVTLLDGLVFARSAFKHSMNYRCVVLFGELRRVDDPMEMRRASAALLDHLAPGRSTDARPPTDEELRATTIVALSIAEGSAKVRTGGPLDDPGDLPLAIWAGELPLSTVADDPIRDPGSVATRTPDYLADWNTRS